MDKNLKKDIAEHFQRAYVTRERQRKKGFGKFMDRLNERLDGFFGKGGFSAPGALLLGGIVLTAVSTPAGVAALGLWTANYVQQIVSREIDYKRARKAVEADIENGVLPDRFNAVIDNRIGDLEKKIGLYREQKKQLPAKGSVVKSFDDAAAHKLAFASDGRAAPAAKPPVP